MTTVWLNGEFSTPEEARISAFDAGVQHAVGLFETLSARGETVLHLLQHLDRLEGSARSLGLSERMRTDALAEAILLSVKKAGIARSRIRVTVTGGDLNLLQGGSSHDPTILIVVQPATEYPEELFDRGVSVTVADGRRNPLDPFESHKTLDYWSRLSALQVAAGSGASEALWFSVSNHLVGGCVSNAIIVKDGGLTTPLARGEEPEGGLPSPVLPGIVREEVLGWAAADGRSVTREMVGIEELLAADEVFLTNSSWGVLPVTSLEREQIGTGAPGPLATALRAWWLEQ